MGSVRTLVCVKQVKQEVPEEWNESMPLPGDIIEAVAEEDGEEFFMPAKARSELSSQLGKLNRQVEVIWVKVRRGESSINLRACVVPERASKLQRRFTIRAASDDRHVAVLADLTVEQCTELQEMSRSLVNMDSRGFNKKGVKYDWKKKVGTYLPDQRSSVISSILFMPLTNENGVEATTARSIAWFSASVSSGAPLVFVNIQTEQIVTSEKTNSAGREMSWGRQHSYNTNIQIVQGIRLWFLPGVAEISIELTPEPGENRFGMDIKRTEEGFICVYSVSRGSAADRAELGRLCEQANATGHLVVISRLDGKSLMPSTASSIGLIHCCDHNEVKDILTSAIDRMDSIHLHVMAWPARKAHPSTPHAFGVASLRPPIDSCPAPTAFGQSSSDRMLDQGLTDHELLLRMNSQQVVQSRPSANGFGRRRDTGTRLESKSQSGKSNPGSLTNSGVLNGSKVGGYERPSRDRLIYLTTSLIGQHVEVQVKNGSIFSGIFHATNTEKGFGIILKMARLTKDGSFRGQKSISDSVSKAPSKTLIIPAKDLVQVIAKGVSVTEDGLTNGLQREKRQDIMIDSCISQSHYVEAERELERWTPDEDDPQCPELENIFDGTWNRKWDQFQTNEALFGVKSTFDEELYTTKLEKGPQMRDLEREASRIAREIEGEETQDLHLAEERGLHIHENFDIDEETRFSSVFRGVDDSGYEVNEDRMLDSRNTETFGDSSGSIISRSLSDMVRGKSNDGLQVSSSSSSLDEANSSQSNADRGLYRSVSNDHAKQLASEFVSKSFPAVDGESRIPDYVILKFRILDNQLREQRGGKDFPKEFTERKTFNEEAQTSKSDDVQSSVSLKKVSADKGLSPSATAFAPSSCTSSKGQDHTGSLGELSDFAISAKPSGATQPVNSRGRPGSSTSSTSECVGVSAASGPGLSPSSSVGSLSSEKSTLNPHAKEFKFNPNAKSFMPSQTPLRPPSPVSDGSFYYPTNASAVQHMHGVPVGIREKFLGLSAQPRREAGYLDPEEPLSDIRGLRLLEVGGVFATPPQRREVLGSSELEKYTPLVCTELGSLVSEGEQAYRGQFISSLEPLEKIVVSEAMGFGPLTIDTDPFRPVEPEPVRVEVEQANSTVEEFREQPHEGVIEETRGEAVGRQAVGALEGAGASKTSHLALGSPLERKNGPLPSSPEKQGSKTSHLKSPDAEIECSLLNPCAAFLTQGRN
ncbi:hypothetical protein HHK36_014357 [Tetracentron sinense]|uniref:LsmAD domain-containing protein n=1 Tax=Tetracentron sinense TaxID=13715 RepID=A0A834Z4X8_TETSI|nr:hypothetical protein HHK36_014357 [Tetracentron sinense]